MNPSFFSLVAGVGLVVVVPAVHGRGDDLTGLDFMYQAI
jgi:hypothetical protein